MTSEKEDDSNSPEELNNENIEKFKIESAFESIETPPIDAKIAIESTISLIAQNKQCEKLKVSHPLSKKLKNSSKKPRAKKVSKEKITKVRKTLSVEELNVKNVKELKLSDKIEPEQLFVETSNLVKNELIERKFEESLGVSDDDDEVKILSVRKYSGNNIDDESNNSRCSENSDEDDNFSKAPINLPHSCNSDDTSTEDSPDDPSFNSGLPPSSSRLMRNLAEKMRRDKLNMYISELSALVPIVAMATKRMDKTSVLRLSANFLRIHLSLKQERSKGRGVEMPEGFELSLSSTLLDALEGFMLIATSSGKIVYVSESVEKLLGHSQLDLMGQSLYTICHNGDTELLRHHLQPSTDFTPSPVDESESGSLSGLPDFMSRSPSFFGGRPEESFSGLAAGERRSFYVRLSERTLSRSDAPRHVTVHLNGILRPPSKAKRGGSTARESGFSSGSSSSGSSSSSSSGDEPLLVCVARPFRNKGITELSLMEAVQDEYVTRHLPDGRIIYSDHRIAFVAGYLTEEVMGHCAFNFIHQDDLPWATVANRQMFSSVEGQGYSVYRLRSKTGSLIHLRTRGFLEFNKTTQKVETFVCINTLLTNEEGDKELEKERERITPFLTFQQVTTSSSTTTTTTTLISPLPPPSSSSPPPLPDLTSTPLPLVEEEEEGCIQPSLIPPPQNEPLIALVMKQDSAPLTPPPPHSLPSTFLSLNSSPLDEGGKIFTFSSSSSSSSDAQLLKLSPGVLNYSSSSSSAEGGNTSLIGGGTASMSSVGKRELFEEEAEEEEEEELLMLMRTKRRGMRKKGGVKRGFSESGSSEESYVQSSKRVILPSNFLATYNTILGGGGGGGKWGPHPHLPSPPATILFDQHNNNS